MVSFSRDIKRKAAAADALPKGVKMRKAVLFDLDGTMWDASKSVADAFNEALEMLGTKVRISVEQMRSVMGRTLDDIAHEFFDCIDPERAHDIMIYCTEHENKYILSHGGTLYEGLRETLSKLREQGWFVGCVSNCQSGYIEAFCGHYRLDDLFDDRECWGNTGLLKADNIRLVVKRNNIDYCVYVGDTMGDYNSAAEAGVKFIHAAYGYGHVPAMTPKIDSLPQIFEHLEELESGSNV